MALRFKPIKIDESKKKAISESLAKQEINRGVPRTFDDNFPVFSPPYGERALVYIPNHVVEKENGRELRMDVSHVHIINRGNRTERVRCVSGLQNLGYDSCPLDDVVEDCYTLANLLSNHEMALKNVNPNEDSVQRKSIRRNHFSNMMVQQPNVYYTFPIVVIETQGKYSPVWNNETNCFNYSVEWVILTANQFDKWMKAVEDCESEEHENLGGLFMRLDYSVGVKEGMDDREMRMTSARNMTARVLEATGNMAKALVQKGTSLEELMKKWDNETKNWDVVKSATTVVQNALYAPEDLQELANDLHKLVNDKMSQVSAGNVVEEGEGVPLSIDNSTQPLGILPEGSIDND